MRLFWFAILAALVPTAARADDHALAREALKREIASMLQAISSAQAAAPAAPASAWTHATPTTGLWKEGADERSSDLELTALEEDGKPLALGQVSTVFGGAGEGDLDGFDHGVTRLHRPHLPRALLARAAAPRVPPDAIRRVVHQNFGAVQLCYESGLRRNPALSGRVAVKFTIDAAGTVAVAADGGSDIPDAQVVACVVRSFANLIFPASPRGNVTVVYPLVFAPK